MADAVAKAWNDYLETVVAPGAGEIQISETKQAFYCGAKTMLSLFSAIGDLSEDEAVTIMNELEREVDDFFIESLHLRVLPPVSLN